jgi:hypothetical protein
MIWEGNIECCRGYFISFNLIYIFIQIRYRDPFFLQPNTPDFALEVLLRTEIIVIINSRPWSTKKVGHTLIQKDLVLYNKRVLYLGVVQYDK